MESFRLKDLELGWNGTFSKNSPRRNIAVSDEIRDFILNTSSGVSVQSLLSGDVVMTEMASQPQHQMQQQQSQQSLPTPSKRRGGDKDRSAGGDAFGTIATAFGFIHHSGTDHGAELQVLKQILIRESLVMKLVHACQVGVGAGGKLKPAAGAKILELMTHVRAATVEYCARLRRWRATARDTETFAVRPFLWEGDNYTLKVCNDLDFLAENAVLAAALSLQQDKLRSNPLMLPNTLDEVADAWIDPPTRAMRDAGGQSSGQYYEERLRLREAERLLLQEIEAGSYEDEPATSMGGEEFDRDRFDGITASNERVPDPSMLQWQPEAVGQLQALERSSSRGGSRGAGFSAPGTWDRGGSRSGSRGGPPSSPPETISRLSSRGGPEEDGYRRPNQQAGGEQQYGFPGGGLGELERPRMVHGRPGRQAPPGGGGAGEGGGRGGQFVGFGGQGLESIDSNVTFYEAFGGFEGEEGEGDDLTGGGMGGYPMQFTGQFDSEGDPKDDGYNYYTEWDNDDEADGAQTGLGGVDGSQAQGPITPMSMYDIEMVVGMRQPPQRVLLAGASVVILVSDRLEQAAAATWEQFCVLAADGGLYAAMNALDPQSVAKFKTRAIQPFLGKMKGPVGGEKGGSGGGKALACCDKLCRWVRQVVSAALGLSLSEQSSPDRSKAARGGGLSQASRSLCEPQQGPGRAGQAGLDTSKRGEKKKPGLPGLSQLWPVHTEILENAFKHPLLLTLLASEAVQSKAQFQSFDPLMLLLGEAPPERLMVKLYDLVDSTEASININIREYTLLLYDLRDKHSQGVVQYYRPASVDWWIAHLKRVSVVRAKPSGGLLLHISKAAIERVALEGMGLLAPRAGSYLPPPLDTDPSQGSRQEQGPEHFPLDDFEDDGDGYSDAGMPQSSVPVKTVGERRALREKFTQDAKAKQRGAGKKKKAKAASGSRQAPKKDAREGSGGQATAKAPDPKTSPKSTAPTTGGPKPTNRDTGSNLNLNHNLSAASLAEYRDDFDVVEDDGDGGDGPDEFEEALERINRQARQGGPEVPEDAEDAEEAEEPAAPAPAPAPAPAAGTQATAAKAAKAEPTLQSAPRQESRGQSRGQSEREAQAAGPESVEPSAAAAAPTPTPSAPAVAPASALAVAAPVAAVAAAANPTPFHVSEHEGDWRAYLEDEVEQEEASAPASRSLPTGLDSSSVQSVASLGPGPAQPPADDAASVATADIMGGAAEDGYSMEFDPVPDSVLSAGRAGGTREAAEEAVSVEDIADEGPTGREEEEGGEEEVEEEDNV